MMVDAPAQSAPSSMPGATTSRARIASLDIIRGVVMVLMAIDHVRVFSGVPAGGPDPGIFFTRWVTNFVAPAFAFLAGTGAYLYGRRTGASRADVAKFLAIRGAWLVLLELTFLRFAWTFNFDYAHYMLAGVIWMLGWCMILLAALIWLPMWAIAAFGLMVILGHNAMDYLAPINQGGAQSSSLAWLWQILYYGGYVGYGSDGTLAVLYSIVPWIGVMAAGYAFGRVMEWPDERRRRFCFTWGGVAIAAFLILRYVDAYGDPRHWSNTGVGGAATPLRFLNTSKYPASLLFLLMTLGPMLVAIPLVEKARGKVAGILVTFGRVPLFFYILHIPLIHALALIVSLVREGHIDAWLFLNHPMMVPEAPQGYMWSLPLLYAVTFVALVILYYPCRWFARLKNSRRDAWLSFF